MFLVGWALVIRHLSGRVEKVVVGRAPETEVFFTSVITRVKRLTRLLEVRIWHRYLQMSHVITTVTIRAKEIENLFMHMSKE